MQLAPFRNPNMDPDNSIQVPFSSSRVQWFSQVYDSYALVRLMDLMEETPIAYTS